MGLDGEADWGAGWEMGLDRTRGGEGVSRLRLARSQGEQIGWSRGLLAPGTLDPAP